MNSDEAYVRLMDLEGVKLTNHPMDPGRKTKFGISELGYPGEDIDNMTPDRARYLYERDYWRPLRCNELRDDLRFEMFETAVNLDPPSRPRRAVMIAQGALRLFGENVTIDGLIGRKTIAALNLYPHRESLLKLMNGLQLAVLLVGSPGERELIELVKARLAMHNAFLRGWLRRIAL